MSTELTLEQIDFKKMLAVMVCHVTEETYTDALCLQHEGSVCTPFGDVWMQRVAV